MRVVAGARCAGLAGIVAIVGFPGAARAAQPLETESARVPPKGRAEFEGSVEFQTASEGTETAVPLVFNYGLTERLELSVEPVVFTSINPNLGRTSRGIGDVEATLKWVALSENQDRPALALGAEVKVPTAKNRLIGTGETDIRAFGALSRRVKRWDLHANLGYTFVGSPKGLQLNNIVDYAAAAEYHQSEKLTWVAEVIGNTSAVGDAADAALPASNLGSESTLAPEAAGNELVGLIGARYNLRPNAALTFGLTYDNNGAWLIRPGVTIAW